MTCYDQYATMRDKEVLHLAAQFETLTPEAQSELITELTRRRLSFRHVEQHAEVTRALKDRIGHVTLIVPGGIGSAFLGRANLVVRGDIEEVDTTLWYFFFGIPVFPIATYRIARPTGAGLLDKYTFEQLRKYPSRNWMQVLRVWAIPAAVVGIFLLIAIIHG